MKWIAFLETDITINMKKLIVLIGIILFSINAKAQKTDEICMPTEVAKQVAADLVTGDSAKALLSLATEEIELINGKMSYKDSLILNGKLKEINLTEQIKNEKAQKDIYAAKTASVEKQYATLSKKYKAFRSRTIFTNVMFIGAILAGAYLHYR